MPLKLDILANTRQFVSEMKKAGASTEDISIALADVVREAGQAERALNDIGTGGGKSLGRVKASAQEVTQEMGSNLGEAVSSVRGNLSDLGQVGQDTLGGLAATLAGAGPAGLVGAATLAAGAVGLGLVTAELEKQKEQAEELRSRLSGAYQEAADEGRAYLDTAQLIAEANDLMFNPERAEEYKRIRDDALQLGLDEATVIDANSGSLEAQEEVLKRIADLRDELDAKPRQQGLGGTAEWDEENKQLRGVEERWRAANDVAKQYAETARDATAQAAERQEKEREQIHRTADAAQSRYEGLAELYSKPIAATVRFDVDTSPLYAAQRRAEAWARNGLRVAVNGTLTGPTWE